MGYTAALVADEGGNDVILVVHGHTVQFHTPDDVHGVLVGARIDAPRGYLALTLHSDVERSDNVLTTRQVYRSLMSTNRKRLINGESQRAGA